MAKLNPLRVYHGTSQSFHAFAPNERGIFFAESEAVAQSYVSVHPGSAARVIEAILDIRRPWQYISYASTVPYRDQLDQSPEALRLLGYDGIHMADLGVWVAFDPSQIQITGERDYFPSGRRRAVATFEGSRFSFAGERARTADLASLLAVRQAARCTGAEELRQRTGWFMGADGAWRFEIDDTPAALLPAFESIAPGGYEAKPIEAVTYRRRSDGSYDLTLSPPCPQRTTDFVTLVGLAREVVEALLPEDVLRMIDAGEGEEDLIGNFEEARRVVRPFAFDGFNALPLGHVLHHPELFRAYPAISEVMVRVVPGLGLGAAYKVYEDGVHAVELGSAMALSNLLHEIQHCIQGIEGFAVGGTVSTQSYRLDDEPQAHHASEAGISPELRYMRLAGEVEARNVQARLGFSEHRRRLVPPESTADVPSPEQIVCFGRSEDALPMECFQRPAIRQG